MIKFFSILILSAYIFGISQTTILYTAHNFIHHISGEQHNEKDCDGTCTIIVNSDKSENSNQAKFFKIIFESISSHLTAEFLFEPPAEKKLFTHTDNLYFPEGINKNLPPPPKA